MQLSCVLAVRAACVTDALAPRAVTLLPAAKSQFVASCVVLPLTSHPSRPCLRRALLRLQAHLPRRPPASPPGSCPSSCGPTAAVPPTAWTPPRWRRWRRRWRRCVCVKDDRALLVFLAPWGADANERNLGRRTLTPRCLVRTPRSAVCSQAPGARGKQHAACKPPLCLPSEHKPFNSLLLTPLPQGNFTAGQLCQFLGPAPASAASTAGAPGSALPSRAGAPGPAALGAAGGGSPLRPRPGGALLDGAQGGWTAAVAHATRVFPCALNGPPLAPISG